MWVKFFFQKYYDEPNYQIIDTDYDNYSIVYACHEDDMQYLWLLTRVPNPDQALLDKMRDTALAALPNFDWSKEVRD